MAAVGRLNTDPGALLRVAIELGCFEPDDEEPVPEPEEEEPEPQPRRRGQPPRGRARAVARVALSRLHPSGRGVSALSPGAAARWTRPADADSAVRPDARRGISARLGTRPAAPTTPSPSRTVAARFSAPAPAPSPAPPPPLHPGPAARPAAPRPALPPPPYPPPPLPASGRRCRGGPDWLGNPRAGCHRRATAGALRRPCARSASACPCGAEFRNVAASRCRGGRRDPERRVGSDSAPSADQ